MVDIPLSVARVIVENLEGKVLFLKRSVAQYGESKLCLPGGKVEWGQTVEQAARQELKDETCLEAENLEFLFYEDGLPESQGDMHVINFYFKSNYSGAKIKLNPESSEFFWLSSKEMGNYSIAFGNDKAVRKYFSIE